MRRHLAALEQQFVVATMDRRGGAKSYAAIDPQQASQVVDMKPISGKVTDLTDDGVILSKKRAEKLHLAVGGTLSSNML